jgi:hypothetical protein
VEILLDAFFVIEGLIVFFLFLVNGSITSFRRKKLMTLLKTKYFSRWMELYGGVGNPTANSSYLWNDQDYDIEEIRILKSQIKRGNVLILIMFPLMFIVGLIFHGFGLFVNGHWY